MENKFGISEGIEGFASPPRDDSLQLPLNTLFEFCCRQTTVHSKESAQPGLRSKLANVISKIKSRFPHSSDKAILKKLEYFLNQRIRSRFEKCKPMSRNLADVDLERFTSPSGEQSTTPFVRKDSLQSKNSGKSHKLTTKIHRSLMKNMLTRSSEGAEKVIQKKRKAKASHFYRSKSLDAEDTSHSETPSDEEVFSLKEVKRKRNRRGDLRCKGTIPSFRNSPLEAMDFPNRTKHNVGRKSCYEMLINNFRGTKSDLITTSVEDEIDNRSSCGQWNRRLVILKPQYPADEDATCPSSSNKEICGFNCSNPIDQTEKKNDRSFSTSLRLPLKRYSLDPLLGESNCFYDTYYDSLAMVSYPSNDTKSLVPLNESPSKVVASEIFHSESLNAFFDLETIC